MKPNQIAFLKIQRALEKWDGLADLAELLHEASPVDKASGLTVVAPDGSWYHGADNGWDGPHPVDEIHADGSAWTYLFGAMDAGFSPAKAVELACRRYTNCGGPVHVYKAGKGHIKCIEL